MCPELKLEFRRKEAPLVVLRKMLDCFVVSESLEGNVVFVDVVNEYLTSPHKEVRCTTNYQSARHGLNSLRCLKLHGASVGKVTDKDNHSRQYWDFKQNVRRLELDTDEEKKHFEECFREQAEFGENTKKNRRQ